MKRRTSEQWLALFAEHQVSGLAAAEFCRQNNLNAKYFSLRKQRLRTNSGAFVKVVTPSANSSFEPIPKGQTLRIRYQGIELCLVSAEPTTL